MKKIMLGVRVVLWLLLVILAVLMLRRFELSQVYHPSRVFAATGAGLGRPFEEVWFAASDGVRLNGWFYPAGTNANGRVILHCHGNAGNISHRLEICDALLDTGCAVLLFDYRGYGNSAGQPSEEGTYLDARAAYAWLRLKGFGEKQIIAYGESLGGGVASELALRQPLGGMVLQSTFTSIPALGAELFPWLPVRWMSRIRYDTFERLSSIRIPVLLLHSRSDELVRFEHARKNFAAANEPKMLRELSGNHNDSLADRAKFIDALQAFLSIVAPSD